ncbi:hypothetical protein J6P92_08480 [bacterium]|nr:hypothetical protein [bacterium]
MICPICKKTIPDNALKCPYCKARTGLVCKKCNTVNSIFDYKCKKCGNEILKSCPNCNSINFPNAKKCRKCGHVFENQQDEQLQLEYVANFVSQQNAKEILVKGVLSRDKKIMSLSGEKGSGKSLVLKSVTKELKNYTPIYGKCTPITQLTPGGVVQDILLNVFNLPNFCLDNNEFKKNVSQLFKNEFPELNNNEILDLINFLYPAKEGTFEGIVKSKNNTFSILNKIFDIMTLPGKFIFIIDNFDFIDGFSYEFFSHYIKKENVWKNLKLILLYSEAKPAKGYFYFPTNKDDSIYLDVTIAPLEYKQTGILVNQKMKKIKDFPSLSSAELQEIYQISNGNPSYINHALCLKYDCELCGQEFELSTGFRGLLEHRLALLSHLNPTAYNVLISSAIIGDKINVNLVKEIFNIDNKNFKKILVYLRKMDYISPLNDIYCEFTSQLLWETIIKTSKTDANYEKFNKKIFKYLTDFTLNSHAIFGIIAQNLKQPEAALNIWTKNTRLASYIGDLNLYAISQKQSLALINEFDEAETLKIRYNISERLGKLLANSNPTEAMEYLPDAISNAQAIGDSPKEIELLAYLSSCCRRTGNYFGDVECVDSVLEKVKPENVLDIALLKTTKLSSLLNIGNCGQIINMIDNEIMPVFDKFFKKKQNLKSPKMSIVYESWLKSYLVLANALVLQGNDRSFEILTILFDIIERNKIQDELFICKCRLTLAFANTMKGNFRASEQILEEVLKSYRENIMDNETIIRWNFINIINNFFRKRYYNMQEDLFQIVTFANNNGDNFTKNILKTLLGKMFRDNDNSKQAMDIFNDQIAYFAKEKMALGALLTWFLIADTTLDTEGPDNALEIAEQALAVAQNPKIDNYFFTILLKMVMVKCYITLSDFESAKIHIESAILMARKFNMKDILSRLYILYGKYFQEIGLTKSSKQTEYLKSAKKLYREAKSLIEGTQNKNVYQDLKKAKSVLKSFCQLHNLDIGENYD